KGTLDVRVANLEIQAAQIPDKPTVLAAAVPADPSAPSSEAKALRPGLATALLGLGVTAALIFVGFCLRARQRRSAPVNAVPTLSFPCTGCGKTVKAAVKLAGKKAQCPRCGQALRIPAT